ncbi:MAG: MCP four helix bundle domain-containing protein, partial [Spirochaetota bacterium]
MKMGMRSKLLAGFVSVAIVALMVGLFGIFNLNKMSDSEEYLFEKCTKPITYLLKMTHNFENTRIYVYRLIAATNTSGIEAEADQIKKFQQEITVQIAAFESEITTDEWKIKYVEFKKNIDSYYLDIDTIARLKKEGKIDEMNATIVKAKTLAEQIEKVIMEMTAVKVNFAETSHADNTANASRSSIIMIIVCIFAFALAVGVGMVLVQSIMKTLNSVDSASDQVASGTQQISSSSEQLSQGANEQAASVEEVSSSLEEMTATIRQNADNASQTEKIAVKSAADAREGGEA